LTRVLPIGAGGDYVVKLPDRSRPVQVEVRGVKTGTPARASSRLGEKCGRIRGAGFISVTTFQHGEAEAAHSYLHFVTPGSQGKGAGQRGPKGKRGKRS
jgi:hypothetical protein